MTLTQLTYSLDADGDLRVSDWGQPSKQEADMMGDDIDYVEYWEILWVNIYVRDFAGYYCGFRGDRGWTHYACFPVKAWCYISDVFDEYLGTAGLYHRVSFHVESWLWSGRSNWEIDDQV